MPGDGRVSRLPRARWLGGVVLGLGLFALTLALPLPAGLLPVAAEKLAPRLPAGLPLALRRPRLGAAPWQGGRSLAAYRAVAARTLVSLQRKGGRIVSAAAYRRLPPRVRRGYAAPRPVWALVVQLAEAGRGVLATLLLMVVFWVFAVLPIAVTALLPLLLFPLLGVAGLARPGFPTYFTVSSQYGHHLIFLFLGTFVLSRGMTRWQLDRRIALGILRIFGARPARLMGGFIAASGFLSLWISNTATTAILVPTALAVLGAVDDPRASRFRVGLLLSVGYAATVGGIGTLVGTAPNAVFKGFADTLAGHDVTFTEWLGVGFPFVACFLPLLWGVQVLRFVPRGLRLPARSGLPEAGPMGGPERRVAAIFGLVVLLWLTRSPLPFLGWPGWGSLAVGPLTARLFNDSAVAMLGAVLLFGVPADLREQRFLLTVREGLDISWGTLLLFGGGLALGRATAATGLALWFAQGLHAVASAGPSLLVLAVAGLSSLLTEFTSNTATATVLMPVMYALGRDLGGRELSMMATATVGTSLAFMSPIATPPNAIVFGSGEVPLGQMFRSGLLLNVLAVLVWWGLARLVVPYP